MQLSYLFFILLLGNFISDSLGLTQGGMAMSARKVLITGANKGIGFGLVKRLLQESDVFVFLGARDKDRGEAAVQGLLAESPEWSSRILPIVIDVGDDQSVAAAAETVAGICGTSTPPLYGIVNNAGVGFGLEKSLVLNTNLYGPRRVNDAFIPLLQEGGRIALTSSASGPNFVAKCGPELKQRILNPDITWEEIVEFTNLDIPPVSTEDAYGLSKACLNAYMQLISKQYPQFIINSCTPGWIATDLTASMASDTKKTPYDGAKPLMMLILDNVDGSGKYYGSDCVRSPLDRYRGPGDPPYTGES